MNPESPSSQPAESWLATARRRGVVRVAASYAVIAWLLIQIADTTFERLGLPDRAVTAVIITALIGFPVALALSWFFDITPQGIARESATPPPARAPAVPGIRRYADIVVIGILVVVVAVLLTRQTAEESTGIAREASIAVLPFTNLSGDPQQEYFSDGIAEEILGRLALVEGLRVAARTSSFALKGKGLEASAIAQRLRVRSILEGSVRRSGEELRLSASLIDGKSGHVLWSKSFTRRAADVFAIQDEVAQAVIAEVLPAQGMGPGNFKPPTSNLSAHDYYLLALAIRWHRDQESRNRTVQHLEQAVALDPRYAQAHAALARAIMLRDFLDSVVRPDAPAAIRAETEARTAVALNESLPSAHGALATVLWRTGREGAAEEYERAFALSPNDTVTLHEYGNFLSARGASDAEQLAVMERILELDPFALVTRTNVLDTIRRSGDQARYEKELTRAFELYGDDAAALDSLSLHWRFPGDFARLYRLGKMQLALGDAERGMNNMVEATFFVEVERTADLLKRARELGAMSELTRVFDLSTQVRLRRWEQWSEALAAYRAAHGEDRALHAHMAYVLLMQDRVADAARELALAEPLGEGHIAGIGSTLAVQGFPSAIQIYRRSGQEAKARALIDEWLPRFYARAERDDGAANIYWTAIAAVESLEGRRDKALGALQRALENAEVPRLYLPKELPWFASLEGAPGYEPVIAEYRKRLARIRAEFGRIDAEFAARKP